MKHILSLLFVSVALVSCENIEGDLKLSSDLSLKDSRGETKTIKAQSYKAEVQFKSEKSFVLKVEKDKFPFSIPRSIPSNGDFSFKAAEVGQDVDLDGSVRTTISQSNDRSDWESCTYTVYQTICDQTPRGPVCRSVPTTRWGRQHVSYYVETTERDVLLSIKTSNTTDVVGDFSGDAVFERKVYTRRSQCL